MKIYVIRHGETLWNVQRRLQGASDTDLNEKGIALARITGEALRDVPFFCCFTSPLKRAKETARLVLGEREIPIYEDKRIREISFGEWEGQDSSLLPKENMENFFSRPERFLPPEGGESLAEVLERTKEFWKELVAREDLRDKTVLVATHGCALRALLHNVYENPSLEDFWHGQVPPNCGVSLVEVRGNQAFLMEEDMVYYS